MEMEYIKGGREKEVSRDGVVGSVINVVTYALTAPIAVVLKEAGEICKKFDKAPLDSLQDVCFPSGSLNKDKCHGLWFLWVE